MITFSASWLVLSAHDCWFVHELQCERQRVVEFRVWRQCLEPELELGQRHREPEHERQGERLFGALPRELIEQ